MTERASDSLTEAEPAGFAPAELAAAGAGLLWLIGSGIYALQSEGGPGFVTILAPALLLGGAGFAMHRLRLLRQEADSLRAALAALRAEKPTAPRIAPAPRVVPVAAPRVAQPAPEAPVAEDQSLLAFDTAAQPAPIHTDEFIRALNFPDGADDHEGIRCLRLALEDRDAARLIRAAQDVLTLLAQDGIFMDDLTPEMAPVPLWRRFAAGERGRSVAEIGGVHDRSSLALTGARMRADAVFRDAAHHFLRQFDRSLHAFEKSATDQDLSELAQTRTARAFMLFGRVAGVFD